MSTALARTGLPAGSHRHGPLLLTIALHGMLIASVLYGMQSTFVRTERQETVVSLLSLSADAAPATIAPPTTSRQLAPQPVVSAPAPAMPLPQPIQQPIQPLISHATAQPAPAVADVPLKPLPPPNTVSTPAQEVRQVAAVPAPAPAATAPLTRGPVTVSGVDYLNPPNVAYPISARRAGLEGKVTLRLLIDEKGVPQRADIQHSSGHPQLDEAARLATLHALFKPHVEDGQPLPVYALVPISFSLK